jgi:hypothetical protein
LDAAKKVADAEDAMAKRRRKEEEEGRGRTCWL